MITIETFTEQLTGLGTADALVEQMLQHIDGFQEDHSRYLSAVNKLRAELGEPVDKAVTAIRKCTASDLLFAGFLGLKMNYDHFVNPMTPNCTWPQVDYNDYLRENIAHSLPEYQLANAVLSDFYRSLTAQQKETYCAIAEYESHLETVGPKLAHYYGYLLGDTLLYRLVPGYQADTVLTIQYNAMLTDYFGKHFLPVALQTPTIRGSNAQTKWHQLRSVPQQIL